MRRNVQLSIDGTMDRPVGRILESVQRGTNADLIRTVAPLYLTGSVLDVTYGRGAWWRTFTPNPFTYHDIETVDGVDFRDLPHDDSSFDTVCFDPPYITTGGGGKSSGGGVDVRERFQLSIHNESQLWDEIIRPGLAESLRVASTWVLAKCMDYTGVRGRLELGSVMMCCAAESMGATVHDLIVHNSGVGPGGHNITTVRRARRSHSYLLVFKVGR